MSEVCAVVIFVSRDVRSASRQNSVKTFVRPENLLQPASITHEINERSLDP